MAIAAAATQHSPSLAGASTHLHLHLHIPHTPASCTCSFPSLQSSSPHFTSLRLLRHTAPPPSQISVARFRPRQFRAEAATNCRSGSGGNGFEEQAGRIAGEARRKFENMTKSVSEKAERVFTDAGQKFNEFQEKSDVEGKAQRFARQANLKLEELVYNIRKQIEKWDRQYRLSEKSQQFADTVRKQIYDADQQFGVRQKARNWTSQLQLRWPTYRRQLSNFLESPLGKLVSTCFFLWFFLSGWLFRIAFLSMWILPFAAPLLIGTISKNAIIEGACPACKTRFIGSRSQVVLCRNCRNVVWQPRQDFSKDSSDPSIIDVDFEEK
ncbi:hypothetical protein O6H91_15G049800 [Diphasiastrum complanatum]|uniref:Uncharacterized protein n=1 Tax=Diphasiastrum complanatum TaxID=34168 RepID=A0ACC2BI45_DIPCM|nr:hypothetical protein O6H91_15G049800 [Diphasiastrum complanatum]